MRVQDENKHTALHRRLVDAEEDRLVIEKQRSDVEEKRLEIEEQNENLGAAPCSSRTTTTSSARATYSASVPARNYK